MKILIVDDSHFVCDILSKTLDEFGECHCAHDGKQAVRLFQEGLESGAPFALVLMDILMPHMDGHAALQQIRSLEETAGSEAADVVMITGVDEDIDMMDSFARHNARAYVVKPVTRNKVLGELQKAGLLCEGDGGRLRYCARGECCGLDELDALIKDMDSRGVLDD